MATKNHNLSKFDSPLPSAADMRFGIVVAEWNREVTEALLEGAVRTLRAAGCPDLNIQIKYVPGTFELALGAQFFAEYTDVDAVIALGCVIQGDTRHFDFICQGVTQGITQLQIQWNMPIAFGVLTVNDMQQALDRCGGRHGNKGDEAAATAVNMVKLQIEMEAASPDHEPDRRNINCSAAMQIHEKRRVVRLSVFFVLRRPHSQRRSVYLFAVRLVCLHRSLFTVSPICLRLPLSVSGLSVRSALSACLFAVCLVCLRRPVCLLSYSFVGSVMRSE